LCRLLTPTCLFVGLGLLAVGLWPLNFRAENHVSIIPEGGGLRFEAPVERSKRESGGLAFTPSPLAGISGGSGAKGVLTLEIALQAATDESRCLKRIAVVNMADGSEAFYIGQWKSSFIVRSFNPPPAAGKAYREIGVRAVLAAGRPVSVTVASDAAGTDIYLYGKLVNRFPGFRLLLENDTLAGHRVYLGNAPDLNCPWDGDVFAFALYPRAMSPDEVASRHDLRDGDYPQCGGEQGGAVACYRFERVDGESIADFSGSGNTLRLPPRLVFEKRFLGLPAAQGFFSSDLALNVAGFVPFGLLVCLRLLLTRSSSRWVCIIGASAMGFAVSLAIEVPQVWLPGRDSSLLDLVANTAGTGLGSLAAFHAWRHYASKNRHVCVTFDTDGSRV
jgi:hypothetical protein